jgi:hypothetical protein
MQRYTRFTRVWVVAVLSAVTISSIAAQSLAARTSRAPRAELVQVKLAYGVSIGIPVGWVLQDAASNRRRTERGIAVIDLAGLPTGQARALLTASPDGNPDRTSVVISVITRPAANQAAVAALEGAQLQQVNAQFREDLEAVMRAEGAKLIEWLGASKVQIGDLYSLVSRYTYRMPNRAAQTIESHRIFLGGGSVGLMLQSPIDEAESRQADFAAIRASFHATALP